jgi:DNA polymerase elongation subunit (family B)
MSEQKDELELKNIKVIAHSYKFKIYDSKETERTTMEIWAMGRGEDRYFLRQENCTTFCYIGLPAVIDKRKASWNASSANDIYEHLRNILKDDAPINHFYCRMKEFYFYQGDKSSPMILMYFKNKKSMDHCLNFIKKPINVRFYGNMQLTMLENSISMVRKIFSLRDCKFSQWFEITGKEIPVDHPNRLSVGGKNNRIKEVLINWENLNPISQNDSKGWISQPVILSFDIETYSDNHKKMPNELCVDHKAYMLQAVSQTLGMKHTRKRYAILIGDCNEVKVGEITTITYQGVSHVLDNSVAIYKVSSESDLISSYADIIMDCDPDIITGYNIMAYDYKYLDTRLGVFYMQDWPQMGRISGIIPVMNKREWSSSAYGFNIICDLEMDGRINIDMLPIVKRDYKLDKYTLDFVCRRFLKRGKHDVSAPQMFKTYEFMQEAIKIKTVMEASLTENGLPELNTYVEDTKEQFTIDYNNDKITPYQVNNIWKIALDQMTKVVMYGVEDAELVIDLFEKLNIWIGLVELSSIVGVSITDLFTRGQQVRCQSQIYNMAASIGYVLNKRVAKKMCFSGALVGDPIPGLYNNIICLDFSSLYPSIMIAYNICYTTFVPPEKDNDPTIPDSMCNVIEFDQEEDENMKNQDDIDDLANDFSLEEKEEKEEKESKKVTRHYRFRFIKKEFLEGIIPKLVANLVSERNIVKGQIKSISKDLYKLEDLMLELKKCENKEQIFSDLLSNKCDIEFKKNNIELKCIDDNKLNNYIVTIRLLLQDLDTQLIILDKRQNALKVSANSMFGFLGAQSKGILPLIEAAMCITAKGRELITQVNTYVEVKYNAKIIYGDTDSSMFDMNIKDSKECDYWGNRLAEEISGKPEKINSDGTITPAVLGLFPPPLKMEFEKAMRLLCFKKKKYAALLINKDGSFKTDPDTGELDIMKKGIVPARRDNCLYLRNTYIQLLTNILLMRDIHTSYALIINCVIKLLSDELPVRGNLTIIRGLGSEYKNDNFFMKLFATELSRVGKPPTPGERLEYVIVKTKEETKGQSVLLGYKMRDIDMWEDSWRYYSKKWRNNNKKVVNVNDNLTSLPESLSKILGLTVETNDKPIYKAEKIDYLYYIEHALMNPLDQLFGVGYKAQLVNCDKIGYNPVYSRCHFCPVQTPVKMISKMVADFEKGKISKSDIIEIIEGLKSWFIENYVQA